MRNILFALLIIIVGIHNNIARPNRDEQRSTSSSPTFSSLRPIRTRKLRALGILYSYRIHMKSHDNSASIFSTQY